MTRFLNILALSCVFSLGGCLSSVLPEPAPADTIYKLASPSGSVTASEGAVIMRIDRPTAPQSLSGNGIVASPDGSRLINVARARWAEPIPSLVQNSFFDVLSTRSNVVGVLPTSGARTDYRAHITIRNFEARFDEGEDNPPMVTVQYTATVSDAGSRNLIGTYNVRKTERAAAASVSAIVDAQNRTNLSALEAVADWLERLNYPS
jgi:ABC-type uncharacterized transport system auxiliary subunit